MPLFTSASAITSPRPSMSMRSRLAYDSMRPCTWAGQTMPPVQVYLALLSVSSRTVGLPIGPEAGHPEAVGVVDVLCSADEVALALLALARSPATGVHVHHLPHA